MAGVRVVGFPEDGRQQHEREASVAVNVVTAPTIQETQEATRRTTRAMARAAGQH